MTIREATSPRPESNSEGSCGNCQELREKLDIALHFLELFDLTYRAHGFDHTPAGWDLTVQELIAVLQSDNAEAALRDIRSGR